MAKKLVSLLCALAMLVTMVSVAAFSASAATQTVDFLSSANVGNWSVGTRKINRTDVDAKKIICGAVNYAASEEWTSNVVTGGLVLARHNIKNPVQASVDFMYNSAVDLSNGVDIDMTGYIHSNIGVAETYNSYVKLILGDVSVALIRYGSNDAENYVVQTGWKQYQFKVAVSVGGSTTVSDVIPSGTGYSVANAALMNSDLAKSQAKQYCKDGWKNSLTDNTTFSKDIAFRDLKISIQGGKLSVKSLKDDVILSNIDVSGVDLSNVTPKVELGSTEQMPYHSVGLLRLTMDIQASGAEYVTLDANGGSCSVTSVKLEGGKPTSLPTPTRNRYQFDGWFTEAEGGVEVTRDTVLTSGGTIYAHWIELPIFGNFTADNTEAKAFGADTKTGKPYTSVDFPAYTTFFNSESFGNALVAETWRSSDGTGVAVVSTLGNFTMSKFSTEFSLYFRNETVADKNHVELQFGGLVVTISKSADGYAYNVSASYNGSDLTLSNTATVYNNIEAELKDDGKEGDLPKTGLRDEMVAAIGSTSGISLNDINRFPAGKISFRVSYENGTLTIETVNSKAATFTATAAVPQASFSNAEVKVTLFSKSTSLILGNWKSRFSNDDEILLTPSGKQPVQGEHLALNFIYTPSDLAGYEGKELSASVTVDGEAYETVLETETYKDPEGKDIECKVVKVKCLRPDKFEDTIAITLTAGDTIGSTYTYSIKQYCFSVFKNSKNENEKQLAVDLLNYGVASKYYVDQTYDYSVIQTEATAAGMPLTDSRDFSDCESTVQGNGSGSLKLKKVGLWLTDDIGLWFSFDKNQAGASDASLVCSVDGTTKVASSSSFTEDGDDYIAVIPVGAVQAFKNVVFYLSTDGKTSASTEYTYSLAGSAYALSQTAVDPNSMTGSELALAYAKQNLGNAILRYCDSCVKYNKK